MKALIFDPFAGISGDMVLGALVGVGVDADWLEAFVPSLGLDGVELRVEEVTRSGIAAPRVVVTTPEEEPHRHLGEILEIVDAVPVAPRVRERAGEAFRALAEAEATVHGSDPGSIHFHEVGALDAVVDVVAAMAAVEELGAGRAFTRPVTVGSGAVEIAHGRYPLPAPATAELLRGLPVRIRDVPEECTTPTGAAVLRTLVEGSVVPERFTPLRIGYGAGGRDPEGRPNVLRILEVEVGAREGVDGGLVVVQWDVDDHDPEYVPAVRAALASAGAVDVVTHPVGMKKGRPGLRMEALAPEADLDAVIDAAFRESSTIGVRYWPAARRALRRTIDVVEWRGERVRVKRTELPGGSVREKAEYDDVLAAAERLDLPVREVRGGIEGALDRRRAGPPPDDESGSPRTDREDPEG